jgi:hypothetical protein
MTGGTVNPKLCSPGLFFTILVLLLAASGVSVRAGEHSATLSVKNRSCGSFLPEPSRQDLVDMEKYFPLSKYRRFPVQLRAMFQRADSEYDTCRGLPDADARQDIILMQRCNRAQRASFLLEKKGWCWGGGQSESEHHWIKCGTGPKNENPDEQYPGYSFTIKDFRRSLRILYPHGKLPRICPI